MNPDFDWQNALYRELRMFRRSETRYAHASNQLQYTEGVRFLVERTATEWLVDLIAKLQVVALHDSKLAFFQLWELIVKGDRSARLICSRSSDDPVFCQRIPFTECPLSYVSVYVQWGVLMLPSEH